VSNAVRVEWFLDIVDRGGPDKLLRQDRQIRRSLEQTDRQYTKVQRSATSVSARQASASGRVATAVQREGRQAGATGRDYRELSRAQQSTLAIGQRIVQQSGRVSSALDRQGRATERLSLKQRLVGSARGAGGGALAAGAAGGRLLGGVAGLAAAGGLGLGLAAESRNAVTFEQSMANVQARLLATGKDMTRLGDFALELGAKTQFSGKQAADAMDELAAQGFGVDQIFKVLPGTLNLASASGADLASAAMIQTEALHGFGLAAGDANRVADVLAQTSNRSAADIFDMAESIKYIAPVAKASGQSIETMMTAVGLLSNVGIKGSQAGTTLRTALVRLQAPTKPVTEALHDLGLRAHDLYGPRGLKPLPQLLGMIVKGSQGMSKSTRNAALAHIFGREALSGMVALVEGGTGKFRRMETALDHSSGAARRAAKIMRNTVAGAWDNFTGSVETASIKLTRRFMPAVRGALNAAAGGVNKAVGAVPVVAAAVGAGLAGRDADTGTHRIANPLAVADPFGKQKGPAATIEVRNDPSKLQQIGQTVGKVARTIGLAAATAGKQLLDAFKPAQPFFENVLLPLLIGFGKGLLGSVVGAFKILIPIIKVTATVLGFIGTIAKPLKPIFEGIGVVIGFVAAGPVLKLLSGLKYVGVAFKVLAIPLRLVGGLFGLAGRAIAKMPAVLTRVGGLVVKAGNLFGKLPGVIGSFAGKVLGATGRLAISAGKGLARLPAKLAVNAYAGGRMIVDKLGSFGGKLLSLGEKLAGKIVSGIGKLKDKLPGLAGGLLTALLTFGKRIVDGIIDGIKSAPGKIIDAVKSLVPGPLRKVVPGIRAGGRISMDLLKPTLVPGGRYQDGGIVPALVSPGEQIVYGNRAMVVPGTPTAADSVFMGLPVGAGVLTWDGQARMAAGASLDEALATQAPHFREGGMVQRFRPGGTTKKSVGWTRVGATVYDDPPPGAFGSLERGFAELGTATSGGTGTGRGYLAQRWGLPGELPENAPIDIARHGRVVTLLKRDRGYGQGSSRYAIDIWKDSWRKLGIDRSFKGDVLARPHKGKVSGLGSFSYTVPAKVLHPRMVDIMGAYGTPDAFEQGYQFAADRTPGGRLFRGLRGVDSELFTSAISGVRPNTRDLPHRVKVTGTGASIGKKNKAALRGMPRAWRGTSTGVQPAIRTLGSIVMGKFPSLSVSSTTGGKHADGSYHYKGQAIDLVGGNQNNAGSWIGSNLGGYLTEGIHNPTLSVKYGKKVPSSLWGARTWAGHAGHIHMAATALRNGGLVRRYRTGTGWASPGGSGWPQLPRQNHTREPRIPSLVDFVGSADVKAGAEVVERMRKLAGLLEQVHRVTFHRLEGLTKGIRGEIRDLAKGGLTGVERVQVRRLRGVLTLLDAEMGKRIGLGVARAERVLNLVERRKTKLDRQQIKAGIDPTSSVGLGQALAVGEQNQGSLQAQLPQLRRQLERAKRQRQPNVARAVSEQIAGIQDALNQLVVDQAASYRALIVARAQEGVDTAQFGLDQAQGSLAGLDVQQRLNRTADTSGGMVARSQAIQTTLLPALQAQQQAAQQQYDALSAIGDTQGARQAMLAVQQAGNDIASAMADAADLVRQAAEQAAQETVDTATHGTTMADLGLQRLELEQRIAGTYDQGGQQRADYIRTQVVPALQAELTALQDQQRIANEQGDATLARQIGEQIAGKQNDILQATLDATEEIAENTEPRKVGGTIGFAYGSDSLSDAIIGAGNGS
jgi:TP901 family phage tail tape measure protein